LQGGLPDAHGLESVNFPVRLGEHGQLNDGLCGYWIEQDNHFVGDVFHPVHGVDSDARHPRIRIPIDDRLDDYPLQLQLNGPSLTVSMLVDPRGSVHATTGILPTKSIAIPPDQYQDQLASLRVTFRTAPVLTPADSVEIPLPGEPGFSWSWIERNDRGWTRVPHHPTIQRDEFIAAFGTAGQGLWEMLVNEGRIGLLDSPDAGLLLPGEAGLPADRFAPLGLQPGQVERGLHKLADAIEDTRVDAGYRPRPVARDGWLELRPNPYPSAAGRSNDESDPGGMPDVDWEETS
jgi:hypothetical protein